MPLKKIKEYIPEFYYKFLPDLFNEEIPEESFTNCQECPMICNSREELNTDLSKPFAPDTKCCTFIPRIPNYFAGAILSDQNDSMEAGKKTLIQKINEKKGIYPQGVYPTKKYSMLYEWGKNQSFGKSLALRCPYYIQGKYNCTLWKYREAICATWFCKNLAQNAGHSFWSSITRYFKHVQESLLTYVIQKEGLHLIDPYGTDNHLSYEDIDDLAMSKEEYSYRWGEWEGREIEFYKHAFQSISSLSKEEFESISGIQLHVLLSEINSCLKGVMNIPEKLKINPNITFNEVLTGYYRIEFKTYIERNNSTITYAFDLPKEILNAFNGKHTTKEVLKIIEQNHKTELGNDIIISLYHHDILIKN